MEKILNRNWGIDCLRGLAILLVLLNHLGLGFRLPLKKSLLGEYVDKRILNAISFNGYEAVFLFFVISGFLICSGILAQYSALNRLSLREFYVRRATRIIPLLLLLLGVLAVFHFVGWKDYRIEAPGQSWQGATASALGLYLNWYEGQTTWLPASWDVLWSLSIEELFYLAFPLLCMVVPRQFLIPLLGCLVLSIPFTKGALDGREIWQEKAYWPGMAAIAAGVSGAWVSYHFDRGVKRVSRVLLAVGFLGLLSIGFFGDLVYKMAGHFNMLLLTGSSVALVMACEKLCAHRRVPWGFAWLAAMGRLSYEIYLTHMFVVLSVVAMYRQMLDADMRWCFSVYVPCIALAVGLASLVEQIFSAPCERRLRMRYLVQVG